MLKTIFALSLLICLATTPVLAIGATAPRRIDNRPSIASVSATPKNLSNQNLTEKQAQLKADRCQLIESRINYRINQYETSRDNHYSTYQNIIERITKWMEKIQARGCDTTSLEKHLAKTKELLATFSATHLDLINSLRISREERCNTNKGAFSVAVRNSQQKMSAFQTALRNLHQHLRNVVKPEMQRIWKVCRPSPKPSASPSQSTN